MSARLSDWMDRHFWDRLVRGFGGIGQLLGIFTAGIDERGINAGVDETTVGTRGLGRLISAAHSGQIQTYLASSPSVRLRYCFSTPGWLNQRAHPGSAGWRACALYRPRQKCPSDRIVL